MNLKKLSIISLLGLALSINASELSEQELKKIATNAIKTVGGKLKHSLETKVKQEGFANAANFCSLEANSLAKKSIQDFIFTDGISENSIESIELTIYGDNKSYIDFYKKNGFEISSVRMTKNLK